MSASKAITCVPITIRAAQVIDSSIPYPDAGETAWVSGTPYVVANTVSYLIGDLYHKFECKQNHTSSASNVPEAFPDDENNQYWIDLGSVNRYRIFHLERNTPCETTSPYTVDVNPGAPFGAVAIGNVIIADDVTLEIFGSAPDPVYSETKELLERYVNDWYEWTYQPFWQLQSTLFNNLPKGYNYTYKLTFTSASGTIKVGSQVVGIPFDIGKIQMSPKIRRNNFSSFTRTFDGEVKITTRRNVPKIAPSLVIDKNNLNATAILLDNLNGVVTFFAGIQESEHDYFQSVFAIGVFREIEYSLDYKDYVRASMEVEAL